MKRIIKFRAWAPEMSLMIDHESLVNNAWNPLLMQKSWHFMQSTGLKDKNEKEIYEGDIIEGFRKGSNSDRSYKGVIEWKQDQCGWVIHCGKYILEILSLATEGNDGQTILSSFQIIGNIYDNPELLNQCHS